ncbi:hypothetical protein RND81_05G013700 [Saponaria officinalis]|uniref:C2H2-type domain-containing protein n=1 Tax=Saponaria officinalis TaxID=3572 RepID=A0AAW1KST9_SAPOF
MNFVREKFIHFIIALISLIIPKTMAEQESAGGSPPRERSRSPPEARRTAVPPTQQPSQTAEGEVYATVVSPPEPPLHKCPKCNSSFRSMKALWGHTHVHSKETSLLNLNMAPLTTQAMPVAGSLPPPLLLPPPPPPPTVVVAEGEPSDKGKEKVMLPDLNEIPEDTE